MGKKGAQALCKNPNWKGGRSVASNGYVLIKMPNHSMADVRGYVYEHRFIAEAKLGRSLEPGEVVHHINGDRRDNRPDNIEICENICEHFYHHRKPNSNRRKPGEDNPIVRCACGCGSEFPVYDSCGRPRIYVSGHNMNKGESSGNLKN